MTDGSSPDSREGVRFVNPGELLYSLPTICEWMPPLVERTPPAHRILLLHEDDWRQVELISLNYAAEIEAMLKSIHDVYQKERSPASGAFRRIVVRDRIPEPLSACHLPPLSLQESFPAASEYDAVEYETYGGRVQGGFAWRTEQGLLVYGRREGEFLHTLCLEIIERLQGLASEGEILESFCRAHQLILIDWCICAALTPGNEAFKTYFSPGGAGYRSIAAR